MVAHSTAQSKPYDAVPENVAGDEPACEARKPVPETHIPAPDGVLPCGREGEEECLLSLWADAKKSGFIMWGKLKYIRVVLCVVVAAFVAGRKPVFKGLET